MFSKSTSIGTKDYLQFVESQSQKSVAALSGLQSNNKMYMNPGKLTVHQSLTLHCEISAVDQSKTPFHMTSFKLNDR